MSNHEYYRAAFSQVKAPTDAVEKALGRRPVKKRRMSRLVPIAVVLALLTTTAYAELDNGGGRRFAGSTQALFSDLMED